MWTSDWVIHQSNGSIKATGWLFSTSRWRCGPDLSGKCKLLKHVYHVGRELQVPECFANQASIRACAAVKPEPVCAAPCVLYCHCVCTWFIVTYVFITFTFRFPAQEKVSVIKTRFHCQTWTNTYTHTVTQTLAHPSHTLMLKQLTQWVFIRWSGILILRKHTAAVQECEQNVSGLGREIETFFIVTHG